MSSIATAQVYINWSADVDNKGIVTVNCELSGDVNMYFSVEVDAFDDYDSGSDYNYGSDVSLELNVTTNVYSGYSYIECELVDQNNYETVASYNFKANRKYYLSD